ncbi:Bifunctional chorismate mutase/prephenate dehydratase [Desulfonema limicola]|uniref:Bifunctional chorismate mutase/prephenate dehydratase n=1 Tax=Desulfonema limicola TaxID=45656 RepID=A0A975BA08_9BACT|nr:prephenate dehydratase [Desulfonema limicola]QTA81486.1 Bifunctional chorismate mutase/prephenate dehydratase [Desulfonema limicola]
MHKEQTDNNFKERLTQLRESIDNIDNNLLELINKRLEFVQDVGKLKAKEGCQVLDSTRESQIFQRLLELNKGPLNEKVLRHLFTQIMAASRQLQRPSRVTFLGPEATFTHIAAMNHFGHSVEYIPQPSIRDVFNEVEKGTCHYGVVPVENSIEGAVNHTLDLFFESELKICAEKYQPISHDLLCKGGTIHDIQKVYSHPQAFAQCRRWLQKYLPKAALKECGSTALAAQKAAKKQGTAAIASSEAAHMYQLEVVASRIEDAAKNTTRFLIIGKDEIHRTGEDKTSLMFVTSHIPGALYKVLKPIADFGLNMVKLESRPTKHENWSYFFFVDIEAHIEDESMQKTLEEMKKLCLFLKSLGSYPRANEHKGSLI